MASDLPRVFSLRFQGGRLVGAGHVQTLTSAGNVDYLIVGGPEARDELEQLPRVPRSEQIDELLQRHPAWHALRREGKRTEWIAGEERARLELGGQDVLVCLGGDVPGWVRQLASGTDPQVLARLLAGAGLALTPEQLASGGASRAVAMPERAVRTAESEPRTRSGATPVETGRREARPPDLVPVLTVLNTALLVILLLVALWPVPGPTKPATGGHPSAPATPTPRATPAGALLNACDVLPERHDAARALCRRLKEASPEDAEFSRALADVDARLRAAQERRPLTPEAKAAWGHVVAALHARLLLARYIDDANMRRLPAERPYEAALTTPRDIRTWQRAFDDALPGNEAWSTLWGDDARPAADELRAEIVNPQTIKAVSELLKAAEATSRP